MTPEINVATEALRTLHRIHRQLEDLRERLARGPRVVRAREANLERVRKERDDARHQHHALKIATDEKQLQLGTSEAAVARRRVQLQQASSNVEYQGLKDQIAASQAANEVLEVEILEALEKVDALADKVKRCDASVAAAEQEIRKAHEAVAAQKPLLDADVARLQHELSEHEAALPDVFREHYFRIVRSRGEDALAVVNGEYCSGCNQHVPVNMINELMLSRPVACRSCGRLLYLPEDEQ